MRFRPRARREKVRTGRPSPAMTRCERIAQECRPPLGHGRHPARQSQPGEVSRAAKPRTQARPGPGGVADIYQDGWTIPGIETFMAKAAQKKMQPRRMARLRIPRPHSDRTRFSCLPVFPPVFASRRNCRPYPNCCPNCCQCLNSSFRQLQGRRFCRGGRRTIP